MNDSSSEQTKVFLFSTPVQSLLSMLPCLLFLYVNAVMLFALLRKSHLLESSRYILFGHLLITDSAQLMISMLIYILAVAMVKMIGYVCVLVTLFGAITLNMSPLNVALMSLERYVAICHPLRHANITTTKRTGMALAVMWTVGSIDSFAQLFLFVRLENSTLPLQNICTRNHVFRLQIYSTVKMTFTIVSFVLVGLIIIYTYLAIMITVRSASSNARDARKAHKTVLLHLIQLCLCLTSTLFSSINSTILWKLYPDIAVHITYALFVGLIIFPKCLSPLIYGLRDHTLRHAFKHYFTFGCVTAESPLPKC